MITCIAVDDEPLALNVIREFCPRVGFVNLVGTCSNASEALDLIKEFHPDLMLLDIHMPSISGLELVKSLTHPPMVIFTTAHPQYALTGFDLDAIDYLVKPIPFDRFLKAMNKAHDWQKNHNADIVETAPEKTNGVLSESILIKVDYATVQVKIDDILYIEGVKDYIKIVTPHKRYLTKSTMKNISEKLPASRFFRVHKSFIVSLERIDKVENNRISIGEARISIGDQYKKMFNQFLEQNRL
ncbi:MAG: LytTR family DNA-binding domain-containing protein [Bacteroidales bacterium]